MYRYLSLLDIVNASEACLCLSEFAQKNGIYKQFADCQVFGTICRWFSFEFSMQYFERILKHAGANIHRIVLDADRLNLRYNPLRKCIISLVLQHCPNLDELRLKKFVLGTNDMNTLKAEKCSVSHVMLMQCSFDCKELATWLKQWPSVRRMTIHNYGSPLDEGIFDGVHSLDKLSLASCAISISKIAPRLLRHRETLRSLSLVEMKLNSDEYKRLVDWAPNLEHLKVSISRAGQMQRFQEFKNLKHLQLQFMYCKGLKNIKSDKWSFRGLEKLQELELVLMHTAVICAVADVTSLRVLRIRYPNRVKGSVIAATIAKLPNLERLYIQKCFRLEANDLVDIVGSSRKLHLIDLMYGNILSRQAIRGIVETLLEHCSDNVGRQKRLPLLLNVTTGKTTRYFPEDYVSFF